VGDIEPFCAETITYVENLKKAGVRAEADVYPNWFHACDVLKPAAKASREAIARFEEKVQYAIAHDFAPQRE
jgi:acetyl esterase/lipase